MTYNRYKMSDTVQQIKEKLSIIDIVGSYVELTKAGKHYKGKSPFTTEKTPSFFVSPDREMYYCFSSQKGGDIFTFVEEMEGVDFKGALKILAEKAGIELVPEDPKKRDEREAEYALLEEATKFFFKNRELEKHVTEIINGRGVNDETVFGWRIGFAKDEWRSLRSYLADLKFTDNQMFKAGLIKHASNGKEPFDVFRDRIMFPISDSSGRVVAFSGRTLKTDEDVPKYVNSPETEFFQKSEILYGYDKAKQGIRKFDFSLIVEGQFDVVLAHQAGYSNAVAVSGTALTTHHVALLQRISNKVVLALDSDRAGISAVKRSSEIMLPKGMDIKVAKIPESKDPADIIKENAHTFKKIIGDAVHVIDFLLNVLRREVKDDRTYKLRVREEILPVLLKIPNRIDREHFEGVISEAVGTTKDAIHYELERMSTEEPAINNTESDILRPEIKIQSSRKDDLLKHIRALVIVLKDEHSDISKQIEEYLNKILSDSEYALNKKMSETDLSEAMFVAEKYVVETSVRELVSDISHSLMQLGKSVAKDKLSKLRAKIKESEYNNDTDNVEAYLKEAKDAQELLQMVIEIEYSK